MAAASTTEPSEFTEMMKVAGLRETEKTDGSDTDPDADAEPKNAGPRGRGPPLEIGSFEKRRELVDGAGLCSLGKWAPANRPVTKSAKLRNVRAILWEAVERLQDSVGATPEQIMKMFDESPESGRPREGDRTQPIHIRLLQALLREGGDPDASGMGQFADVLVASSGWFTPQTQTPKHAADQDFDLHARSFVVFTCLRMVLTAVVKVPTVEATTSSLPRNCLGVARLMWR